MPPLQRLRELQSASGLRIADLLSKVIFGALLALLVITAIPYGTFEAWWKAAFICGVFAISILAIIESLVSDSIRVGASDLLLPMLALAALAFIQTLSLGAGAGDPGRLQLQTWHAISADPYQTRFVVLQLLALTACLALLYRYAAAESHVRVLVYLILGIAVASSLFGMLRQTTQQQAGFLLPLLKQNQGFAQFLNKNHFAYLMEMAFGLGIGLILAGGIKRDRLMIYVALLLPVWTGLVLSNSRGGVLAMLIQIAVAMLFVQSQFPKTPRLIALRVVLLVVLVAGVLIGTLWVGGDRLVSNFEAAGTELTTRASDSRENASRNEIWRATLKMSAAHPLLGVGLGGYWIGITAYHDASGTLTPQQAHNDYLELLASGGVIGFALGVWFAVSVLRRARRNLQSDTGFIRAVRLGAVLGIAGVAAHSLVDFGLHLMSNGVVFTTLLMMATATIDPELGHDSSRLMKK